MIVAWYDLSDIDLIFMVHMSIFRFRGFVCLSNTSWSKSNNLTTSLRRVFEPVWEAFLVRCQSCNTFALQNKALFKYNQISCCK